MQHSASVRVNAATLFFSFFFFSFCASHCPAVHPPRAPAPPSRFPAHVDSADAWLVYALLTDALGGRAGQIGAVPCVVPGASCGLCFRPSAPSPNDADGGPALHPTPVLRRRIHDDAPSFVPGSHHLTDRAINDAAADDDDGLDCVVLNGMEMEKLCLPTFPPSFFGGASALSSSPGVHAGDQVVPEI